MDASTISIVAVFVAAAAFAMNMVMNVRNGQWSMPDRLNTLEKRIMNAVSEHREHTDSVLSKTRGDLDEAMGETRREFGETVHAMQSKLQQFELWVRDNFVRSGSFLAVTKETKDALTTQNLAVEKRFDKIEAKIDLMIERQSQRLGLNPE